MPLASDDAGCVTRAEFHVDGGILAGSVASLREALWVHSLRAVTCELAARQGQGFTRRGRMNPGGTQRLAWDMRTPASDWMPGITTLKPLCSPFNT